MADAEKLALQQRNDNLQQHIDSLHGVITDYERENAKLKAELEAVKRERNVAIMALVNASRCESCKYYLVSVREEPCCDCGCIIDGLREKWEWRGLCVENGGAE